MVLSKKFQRLFLFSFKPLKEGKDCCDSFLKYLCFSSRLLTILYENILWKIPNPVKIFVFIWYIKYNQVFIYIRECKSWKSLVFQQIHKIIFLYKQIKNIITLIQK